MAALQQNADQLNNEARRDGRTDRYCRSGKLSTLAWPLDSRRECGAVLTVILSKDARDDSSLLFLANNIERLYYSGIYNTTLWRCMLCVGNAICLCVIPNRDTVTDWAYGC